jgi:phage baseplate assembly protein V
MEKLLQKIRTLLGRGIVNLINAEGAVQLLQIRLNEETLDSIPYLETYGYTAVPLPGAEAFTASLGGNRSKTVALVVGDRRYRLKGLLGGEVALYTDEGDFIHFKRGGHIHHKAGTKITLETPLIECTQNLKINGELQVLEAVTFEKTLHVIEKVTLDDDIHIAGISTAADHVSGEISTIEHVHGGVTIGTDVSGLPEVPAP